MHPAGTNRHERVTNRTKDQEMSKLRYKGDVVASLPKVLGGRFVVLDATYDGDADQTVVEVSPLRDPLKQAGL